MKDFDTERVAVWRERLEQDRTFRLGGQEFTYRVMVAPEALAPWFSLTGDEDEIDAIAAMDKTVLAFLEPGQDEKWWAARSPDVEPPITGRNILDLCKWLLEEQAGRPTGKPSGSSPESATEGSGTTSTAGSDSPVLQAV